jgi:RecA/RadA recombinase
MSFIQNLIKEVGDEDTHLASDGGGSAEFSGYIDTGCYILNAILSGSLYGGVPDNKITAFAGESATGKTFFVLGIVRAFLDKNSNGVVVYYDTEAAVTKTMMESRGIDTSRVIIAEPDTIQKFKTHALKLLDAYGKQPEDTRPPMMFVLDSLGLLSTTKEMEDSLEGKDVRDMTKSQVIKAAFRVLTLKLAKVKVPMLITNHVYDVVGSYVPTKDIGGGCLVAGTRIQTEDGLKSIENVRVGDKVHTLNGLHDVTDTFVFDDKDVYEVGFEDGTSVRCSGNHKFLSDGMWVSVEEMIEDGALPIVERVS